MKQTSDGELEIRLLANTDSLDELTALLHRAYASLAARGWRYIEPSLQRRWLGSRLMDFVEQRAADLGATEIALDTAEPARTSSRSMRRGAIESSTAEACMHRALPRPCRPRQRDIGAAGASCNTDRP